MRKLTFASIASIAMVPALFWSQDSSAVPAFARKYQTSCYTCHSGFPNRNAFGEAFKNNGYRWPGGEEEDHAKQEPVKMGADGWKKTFPESPWPSDIPGFAPFALYLTGPLVNYSDQVKDNKNNTTTPQTLNWGSSIDARILFGGTVGEHLGVVGAIEGISAGTTTTNLRAVWAFAPGYNFSFGNSGFSAFRGLSTPISAYTNVLPSMGVGPEFNYVVGKEGGLNVIVGATSASDAPNGSSLSYSINGAEPNERVTATSTKNLTNANKIGDIGYVRLKYKFFGAGLLSGAGGTYGNEYVGLDNSLAIGASAIRARSAKPFSYGGGAETVVYGADIAGNYGSFTGGIAYSKDGDLKLNNYAVDAGYYVYPWLLPRVTYKSLGVTGGNENPTIATSVTAYPGANIFVKATYTAFTKHLSPTSNSGENNANTFVLNTGFAF